MTVENKSLFNTSVQHSVCESVLMAQVLIFGVLTFLFLQLTAGQDPCANALFALNAAAMQLYSYS